MANYKTMYLKMFNVVTDIERQLQQMATTLRTVQQECEEMYMKSEDAPIYLSKKNTNHDE